MIDARNVWQGVGGMVSDVEHFGNTGISFRLAVDGAGRHQTDKDNYSGYFDAKYFIDENTPNGRFVKSQIDAGNIKKGSQLGFVGRLVHETWENDKGKGQRVVIYVESMTYVGGGRRTDDNDGQTESNDNQVGSAPANF